MWSKRHGVRQLDFLSGKAGVHFPDVADVPDLLVRKLVERVHVFYDDLRQVAVSARNVVACDNARQLEHCGLELLRCVLRIDLEHDVDKRKQLQTQDLSVDAGVIAGDHIGLKSLHAFSGRGSRKVDLGRKLCVCQPPLFLEVLQDGPVTTVL
jgi:hypothetical protein